MSTVLIGKAYCLPAVPMLMLQAQVFLFDAFYAHNYTTHPGEVSLTSIKSDACDVGVTYALARLNQVLKL